MSDAINRIEAALSKELVWTAGIDRLHLEDAFAAVAELRTERDQLRAQLTDATAALREMVTRFEGLFDAYALPTYETSEAARQDLNLSLVTVRAVLAKLEPKK